MAKQNKPKSSGYIDITKQYGIPQFTEEYINKAMELNKQYPGSKFVCTANGCADIASQAANAMGHDFGKANAWEYGNRSDVLFTNPNYAKELENPNGPLHDPTSYNVPNQFLGMENVLVGLNRKNNLLDVQGNKVGNIPNAQQVGAAKTRKEANDSLDYANQNLYKGSRGYEHIGYMMGNNTLLHGTSASKDHPAFFVLDDISNGIDLSGYGQYEPVEAIAEPTKLQTFTNKVRSLGTRTGEMIFGEPGSKQASSNIIKKENGGWLDKYEPGGTVAKTDATRVAAPALKLTKTQLEKNKAINKQVMVNTEKANAKKLAERKKGMAESSEADIINPNDKRFAIGDKFRMFPNDVGGVGEVFDDFINPAVFVGDTASGLGNAMIDRDPAALAIETGIALGAGASGFDPLGGVMKAIPNTYKINPFAFKPQEGMMYRGLGEAGARDAIESGVFRPLQHNYPEKRTFTEIVNSPKQFGSTYYAPAKNFNVVDNYGSGFVAEVPYEGNNFGKRYGRKDWSYMTSKQIPVNEGRLLQKDWLQGYKPIKEDGGLLEKYNDGGPVQPNYNDYFVSAGPGFEGDGYSNVGRNYSPAWGGQFAMGGSIGGATQGIPGATGFMYARTGSIPSNGKYAKKTMASAQDGTQIKTNIPVPIDEIKKANASAEAFNKQYVQSPNYLSLLKKQGYSPEEIKRRQDQVLGMTNDDYTYTNFGPNYVYDDEESNKTKIQYNQQGLGDWANFGDIAAHEWGHVGVTRFGEDALKPAEQHMLISRLNMKNVSGNEDAAEHDMAPQENRADLVELRKALQDRGIYDSFKGGKFKQKHLNELRNYKGDSDEYWNRSMRLYKDKDIIKLMNTIAANNPQQGMPVAQNGMEMKFYQEGLDFNPKSISEDGSKNSKLTNQEMIKKLGLKPVKTVNPIEQENLYAPKGNPVTGDGTLMDIYNFEKDMFKRGLEVVANPISALSALNRHGRLPRNFSKGEFSPFDIATSWFNPAARIESGINTYDSAKNVLSGKGGFGDYADLALNASSLKNVGKAVGKKIKKIKETINFNKQQKLLPNRDAADWMKNMYSDPVIKQRILDNTPDEFIKGYTDHSYNNETGEVISNVIPEQFKARRTFWNDPIKNPIGNKNYNDLYKEKGFKDWKRFYQTTNGVSYGNPEEIYVKNKLFDKAERESVRVHEATHAMEHNGWGLFKEEEEKLLKPFGLTRAEQYTLPPDNYGKKYYTDPTEIHARMNESRYKLGHTPGQEYNEVDFMRSMKMDNMDGMGDYIKDPKAFIELMNTFYQAAPVLGAGALGAAAIANQPEMEQGGQLTKLDQLTNFTNYNTKQPGGWLDKYQ